MINHKLEYKIKENKLLWKFQFFLYDFLTQTTGKFKRVKFIWFNGTSSLASYLMPNPVETFTIYYFKSIVDRKIF